MSRQDAVSDALTFLENVGNSGIDYGKWALQAIEQGFEVVAALNAKWAAQEAFRVCPDLRGELDPKFYRRKVAA